MADGIINTTTVNDPPTTALDAEVLTGEGPSGQDVYRERVQVTGAQLDEIARVLNQPPGTFAQGLVVRPIGHAHDSDTLDHILVELKLIRMHLAAMSDEHITGNDINPKGDV